MTRFDLQSLSKHRRREALVLLSAKQWGGAYYLVGYALECALKAVIAKNTKMYDFPDKEFANQVYTHDLERLVKAAGLSQQMQHELAGNPPFSVNWAIAKDWDETSRYDLTTTAGDARDLYSACVRQKTGVLSWVKARW